MTEEQPPLTKMKMKVELYNPYIKIPMSVDSDECLVTDLGYIHIENQVCFPLQCCERTQEANFPNRPPTTALLQPRLRLRSLGSGAFLFPPRVAAPASTRFIDKVFSIDKMDQKVLYFKVT